MKDYWAQEPEKKLNKRKVLIISGIIFVIAIIIAIISLYVLNEPVRKWIDKNIFRKEIKQENVTSIDITDQQNANVYAFGRYIGVLNKNKFQIYNDTGKEEENLEIEISNPIFNSSNRFLVMAENKGKKVYLLEEKKIAWDAETDGEITQIHVNKNGYVAVMMQDPTHKVAIAVYSPDGTNLFKWYVSTRVVDVCISNDNKNIAIAEVDTSGAILKSSVKILSLEKAQNDSENSIEKTYQAQEQELITQIKYQDKGQLVCMYTDAIKLIYEDKEETLVENKDKKIAFSSIEMNNCIANAEEVSSGLFSANSVVNIMNVNDKNVTKYTANSVAKEMYTYEDVISLNLGTEVEFINTGGWLIKRYLAKQEITNIVISNSLAGIVYRDRIEIIKL